MSTTQQSLPSEYEQAANGEPGAEGIQAFSAFYDRFSAPVYTIALRVLADHTLAEDVTEEAFCQVWLRAAYVDGFTDENLHWLLWLTHSLAMTARRRAIGAEAGARAASYAVTPQECLAHVADERQRIVEMAFWGGHTCREIATSHRTTRSAAHAEIQSGLRNFADSPKCIEAHRRFRALASDTPSSESERG